MINSQYKQGFLLVGLVWNENVASPSPLPSSNAKKDNIGDNKDHSTINSPTKAYNSKKEKTKTLSVQEVISNIILTDPRIILIGLVQVIFKNLMRH